MRTRRTAETVRVLTCTAESRWVHGYRVMERTGLAGGAVYPMLDRCLSRVSLGARVGEGDPVALGRLLRNCYLLTEAGSGWLEAGRCI